MVPYFLDFHENIRYSKKLREYQEQPYPKNYYCISWSTNKKRVTFVGYSWNSQGIFLYLIFPGHYFGIVPEISFRIFSRYTGNISRECSTNIPRTYIYPVGNGLVRKVTTFIKSSTFDVWHGSISLQFLKNLKLNRLIYIEYRHNSDSATEDYALFINVDHKHGLYPICHAWTMK